jgi:hypothetical protein
MGMKWRLEGETKAQRQDEMGFVALKKKVY